MSLLYIPTHEVIFSIELAYQGEQNWISKSSADHFSDLDYTG